MVKVTTFPTVTVVFLFACVGCLCSCSVPDNIRPQNKMLTQQLIEHSQHINQIPVFQADWPQELWWKNFNDSQLNQLVQQSLLHSPTLQLAQAKLTQANALVAQADSQFDPTLTAETYMRRSRLSRQEDYAMRGNQYSTSRGLGLDFSYNFDLWGGNRAAWEAASRREKSS
ncbi:TolC family protein [Vibrio sp. PP-XX7]